ncbi:MAG: hypothetical protein ABIQ95_04935 [Bdellovibrionia bacterium]
MNGTVFSSPSPLSTGSAALLSSSPCKSSGYYPDATTCQVGTGLACAVLVLTTNGVSYACYNAAAATPSPVPNATPHPTANTTTSTNSDSAACSTDGGVWSGVPTINNVYGCKFSGGTCGKTYNKMFAADFGASICNAPSTSAVQPSKKDGGKLCHNEWDGALFKFRCSDNEADHVKAECANHITAMNSNFFKVSLATFQGTYVFPNSSSTLMYPNTGIISCYTKLYCDQNTTVGGWGNCPMAWGTACWPDFNANWLQNPSSNESTTLKSIAQNVYCGKT